MGVMPANSSFRARALNQHGGIRLRVLPVGGVDQNTVAEHQNVVLAGVGEDPVEAQPQLPRARTVDADRQHVEELLAGEQRDHLPGGRIAALMDALAQLVGAHQEEVAPRCALGSVGKLLQRLGLQLAGLKIGGVGEHRVGHQLRHPAVVALGKCAVALPSTAAAPPIARI